MRLLPRARSRAHFEPCCLWWLCGVHPHLATCVRLGPAGGRSVSQTQQAPASRARSRATRGRALAQPLARAPSPQVQPQGLRVPVGGAGPAGGAGAQRHVPRRVPGLQGRVPLVGLARDEITNSHGFMTRAMKPCTEDLVTSMHLYVSGCNYMYFSIYMYVFCCHGL